MWEVTEEDFNEIEKMGPFLTNLFLQFLIIVI